jgi:hypothetical protein
MDLSPMRGMNRKGAAITSGALIVMLAAALGTNISGSASSPLSPMLGLVTHGDGSPKAGHDPANRPQQSLSDAAARPAPTGPDSLAGGKIDGSVGLNPDAAGVNDGSKTQAQGGNRAPVAKPEDVLTDFSITGGCRIEYGPRGECLPYVPPSHVHHPDHDMDTAWECAEVRKIHPQGIALKEAGVDPLGLDTNADNIACGPGD